MGEQDIILRLRPQGIDNFRNKMRAALGGVQSDIRRINRQTSSEQLRSIDSQISTQQRLGQIQRQIDTRRGSDGRFISRQRITALRLERQQIIANARVSRLASSRQLIALRSQKTAFRDLQSSTAGFRTALNRARIAAFAIGAIGLFMVIRSLKQSISLGINLNKEFEAMRVGVAATLAANTKITDSLGRQLTGFRAVVAAQQLSRKIQRQILSITIETGGTLDVTLQAFRIALPLVLRVGGTLEDALDIVKRLNLAAIAIGIPIDLVRVQIDDILKGVITTRTLLAQVLGITQQQLKAAKEQGRLLEFVREKTQAFVDAQSLLVGKFAAVLNITKALGQEFARLVTESAFEVLRGTLSDIIGQLVILDERTGAFKGFRPEVQELALELRKNIGDLTQAIRDSLPTVKEFIRSLNILSLAAKGAFEAFPTVAIRGETSRDLAKRIESFFVGPGEKKGLLFKLLFGPDGPEDLEKDVEGVLKRIQASAGLITALPKFAEVTQEVVITSGRALAVLKKRLEEAEKAAAQFPKGVFAAREAIASLLSLFDPTRTKDIEKFADLLNKSGDEALKLRSGLDRLRDSLASLLQQQKIKRIGRLGILGLENLLEEEKSLNRIIGLLDIGGGSIKTQAETTKTLINLIRQRQRVEDAITKAQKEQRDLIRSLGQPMREAAKLAAETAASFSRTFKKRIDLQRRSILIGSKNEREAIVKTFEFERNLLVKQLELERRLRLASAAETLEKLRQLEEEFQLDMRDLQKRRLVGLAESIASSAERVFDAMLTRGRSVFRSLADFVKGIFQSILRVVFREIVKNLALKILGAIRKLLKGTKLGNILFGKVQIGTIVTKDVKIVESKITPITAGTVIIQGGAGGGGAQGILASLLPFAAAGGGAGGGKTGGGGKAGQLSTIRQIGFLAGVTIAAEGLRRGGKTGFGLSVGGAALAGFSVGGPIGAAIGAAVGAIASLISNAFGKGARNEARRQRRVQAAIERQTITLPSGKTFRFADAASIQGIFGSTVLERPGGRFLSVPQEAGFTTGMAGPVSNFVINVSARTMDDAEEIGAVVRRKVQELLPGQAFRNARFSSEIREITVPA